MQWDNSPQAGFTTGTHPWLAVNPKYKQINAAEEESDPASVLNYVRTLVKLRAQTLAFVYGDFEDLDPQHPRVFAYTRTLGKKRYFVVDNVSSAQLSTRCRGDWKRGRCSCRISPTRTKRTLLRSNLARVGVPHLQAVTRLFRQCAR